MQSVDIHKASVAAHQHALYDEQLSQEKSSLTGARKLGLLQDAKHTGFSSHSAQDAACLLYLAQSCC